MNKIDNINKINSISQNTQNKPFCPPYIIKDYLNCNKTPAPFAWIKNKTIQFINFLKNILCCKRKTNISTIWETLNNRLEKSTPQNALEDLIYQIKTQKIIVPAEQLQEYFSENELKAYLIDPHDIKNSGNTACINLLLSQQFRDKNRFCYVSEKGQPCGAARGKVGYTADPINPFTTTDQIQKHLQNIIQGIKDSGLRRCLIPLGIKNQGDNFCHFIFIAIDLHSQDQADITIVNTHGNSLRMYRDQENQILHCCRQLFPHSQTRLQRNTDCIFSNAYSCVADGLGLMNVLAKQNSSYDFVACGGISRWKLPENYRARLGRLTQAFINSLH